MTPTPPLSSTIKGDSGGSNGMRDNTSISSASALVIAASDKAGMEGIDRARIDEIILRESGDSAYIKQQRKRDQAVNEKIQHMKQRLQQQESSNEASSWRPSLEQQLEPEIQELLQSRRPRSSCVVVDMDMFYMACELLTRPDLANKPACVGTGMILTSNYCARRFGVRSAMAGWIADKLVTELTDGKQRLHHIPSNFELYTQKSHVVRQVLAEYDPQLRAYSLDEAYLDVGPYVSLKLDNPEWTHEQIRDALMKESETKAAATLHTEDMSSKSIDNVDEHNSHHQDDLSGFSSKTILATASEVVYEMRLKVKEATGGLTCSAGLASNFMLAKIASDKQKPNGQCVIGPSHEDILDFVHELPTRKIPGIGRVTEKMLQAFDITTVKQLYEQRALVRFLFTPATAKFLLRASLGCASSNDSNNVEQAERKGISRERTFQSGRPWSEVNARLEDIARLLSSDMKKKNLRAHTITVKVKLDTFDVLSRSRSMPRGVYLQEGDEMVNLAAELVQELKRQHKGTTFSVRLLGVRCSNFQGDEERAADENQMSMDQFLCSNQDCKRAASSTFPSRCMSPKRPFLGVQSNREASPTSTSNKSLVADAVPSPPADSRNDSVSDAQHCPMCGQVIREGNDNDAVNRHIDACLNSSVIREAIQEESLAASARQGTKKQRLTDFFQTTS